MIVNMKNEPAFSRGGAYRFTLEKNLGLHCEATAAAVRILGKHFSGRLQNKKPLHVLDLACGGRPVVMAEVMAHFGPQIFEYTGVDVNPDQVASCLQFDFPKNVASKKILEGDAWNLDSLPLKGKFDIVFIGLNTHHGSPEVLLTLARQVFSRLNAGGIFLNHDLFRPEKYSYVRKPNQSPWREEWLTNYHAFVLRTGVPAEAAAQGNQHMREWDYPLSKKELCDILNRIGFRASQHSYTSKTNPFVEFYGMVAGVKDEK